MMEDEVKVWIKVLKLCPLFVLSCAMVDSSQIEAQTNKLIVNLKNIPDSTYLFTSRSDLRVDSFIVIKGKGELEFIANKPENVFLENRDFKKLWYKNLWLEASDITVEGDYNEAKNVKIIGSHSNDLSDELLNIDVGYRSSLDSINREKNNLQKTEGSEEKIFQKKLKYVEETKRIIKKNNNAYVSLWWLGWQCIYKNLSKKEISGYYDLLTPELQKDSMGVTIRRFVSQPEVPQIGDEFIDFEQVTPNGKTVRLSDFKGKITLVEFWGSGCFPCRKENPAIVKLYEKYHPLGFEILGVSMDDNKERWTKAIKEDHLPWDNVSDLKGVFNSPGLIYGVTAIPNNFLINEKGIITHKNLRGDNLKNTLEELFR